MHTNLGLNECLVHILDMMIPKWISWQRRFFFSFTLVLFRFYLVCCIYSIRYYQVDIYDFSLTRSPLDSYRISAIYTYTDTETVLHTRCTKTINYTIKHDSKNSKLCKNLVLPRLQISSFCFFFLFFFCWQAVAHNNNNNA